jgi:hypothetical protein
VLILSRFEASATRLRRAIWTREWRWVGGPVQGRVRWPVRAEQRRNGVGSDPRLMGCSTAKVSAEAGEVEIDGDGVAFGRRTWMLAESEAKDSARNSNWRVAPVRIQPPS